MESNGLLKAAIYCRLSRDDGFNDESESITNQKMLLTEYCLQKNWDIYDVYCDDDYSGLDINRPQFNRLIKDAKNRKFDIIVCKNQSRFSRDMEVIEKYIHYLLPIWGIRFIGVVDNADTLNKYGKKARQINGLINEWYCEDISENVKAALNVKKRNGQYLGFWCPYGYRLTAGNSKKLEADPEAAYVVKRIFDMYCQGISVNEICQSLTKDGIKTPYEYKRSLGINYFNPSAKSENRGIWSASTVRKILKDRTYTGALIQCREKKISYKSRKIIRTKPQEWIEVENCHEGIIDSDVFKKAEKIMALRRRNVSETKGGPLIGKVCCMQCGSVLVRNNCHSVMYLRCPQMTKNKGCTMKSVKYDDIEEVIKSILCQVLERYTDEKSLWIKYNNLTSEKTSNNQESAALRANAAQNALAKAYIDFGTGRLKSEDFEFIKQRIKSEKNFYIKQEKENSILSLKEFTEILDEIKHEFDFNTINSLINYIEVGNKNNGVRDLKIHWRF